MGRNTPVPIRFDSLVREELETLTAASGLSLSDLCRLAVDKFLDEVATTGSVSLSVSSHPSARNRPVFQPSPERTKAQANARAKSVERKTSPRQAKEEKSEALMASAAQPSEPDFPL